MADLQSELAKAYASVTQAQSELLSSKLSLNVVTGECTQLRLKVVALEDAVECVTDKCFC